MIALFGTVLGLGVGSFFGWAVVRALADEGIDHFTVPVGNLAVVTVIACLAGAVPPSARPACGPPRRPRRPGHDLTPSTLRPPPRGPQLRARGGAARNHPAPQRPSAPRRAHPVTACSAKPATGPGRATLFESRYRSHFRATAPEAPRAEREGFVIGGV